MYPKVIELNLEYGSPTVEIALQKMKNALTTYKSQGVKAVYIIHGYGSTGVGGGIKTGVRKVLSDSSMQGIVRTFCGGEEWINKKREILSVCKVLENYERKISANNGITVVVLK
jgi:hypothetical protein